MDLLLHMCKPRSVSDKRKTGINNRTTAHKDVRLRRTFIIHDSRYEWRSMPEIVHEENGKSFDKSQTTSDEAVCWESQSTRQLPLKGERKSRQEKNCWKIYVASFTENRNARRSENVVIRNWCCRARPRWTLNKKWFPFLIFFRCVSRGLLNVKAPMASAQLKCH